MDEENNQDLMEEVDPNRKTKEFVEQMKNNTKIKTKSDVNKFKAWLIKKKDQREIEKIPPKELDSLMAQFFLAIRKTDGLEYEPDSLSSYRQSIW